MKKQLDELPSEILFKLLVDFYSTKYPGNPEGILRLHIDRKVGEGQTEREATILLSKQIPAIERTIDSLPKEFLAAAYDPIEKAYPARYLGGHPLHPDSKNVKICLKGKFFQVPELEVLLPYERISDVKSVSQKELQTSRLLLVGVFALAWKKRKSYLHMSFADKVGMSHNMIFDIENVEDVVPDIYRRVVAAKEKSQ